MRPYLVAGFLALAFSADAAAQTVVRIGAPLPLTGSLAEAGARLDRGYDACKDAVNARGLKVGGQTVQVELVKYDYQSETPRAVQTVQRLLTADKVNFLMSPYGSGDTKAAAAIAERYRVPMIASGAATESIFDQNFKYIFGTLFPNRAISEGEVTFIKGAAPAVSTLALLSMNSLFPKAIAAGIKGEAEKAGIKIVYEGQYSPGTVDFASALTQIKAANPDWIYVTGYSQETIQVRREMKSLGLNAKVVGMGLGPAYPEYVENLKELAENVVTSTWWHRNARYKDDFVFGSSSDYAAAHFAKHKVHPTDVDASATAACTILMQAIEKAGTLEPEKVRDTLASTQFDTFFGPVRFGANGQNSISRPLVLQIQDGQPIVLSPSDLKQGTLRLQ